MTEIKQRQIEILSSAINSYDRILITSHLQPDLDALCSSLLLKLTLEQNYPAKKVELVLEDSLKRLQYVLGNYKITTKPLAKAVEGFRPQMIILTDCDSFSRATRKSLNDVRKYVEANRTFVLAIDHHEPSNTESLDLLFNQLSPAASQDVYEICCHLLKLKMPDGFADLAMYGLLGDTDRFRYKNPAHRKTFEIASELIEAGANIERLEHQKTRYSKKQLMAFSELISNTHTNNGFTYSYISDTFRDAWQGGNEDLKAAVELYGNQFLRNIEQNLWGFVIYPDLPMGNQHYKISFRALDGIKDVAELAQKLGGGGHKPAAGGNIKAETVTAAIGLIKREIGT